MIKSEVKDLSDTIDILDTNKKTREKQNYEKVFENGKAKKMRHYRVNGNWVMTKRPNYDTLLIMSDEYPIKTSSGS